MSWEIRLQDGREFKVLKCGPGAQVDFERQYDQPAYTLNVAGRLEWKAFALHAQLRRMGRLPDDLGEFAKFLDALDACDYIDDEAPTVKHLHRVLQERELIGKGVPLSVLQDAVLQAEKDAEAEQADQFAALAASLDDEEAGESGKDPGPEISSPT